MRIVQQMPPAQTAIAVRMIRPLRSPAQPERCVSGWIGLRSPAYLAHFTRYPTTIRIPAMTYPS